MHTPPAATRLDTYRQAAIEDVSALVSSCRDGDPYELRLIVRNEELAAKLVRTGRLSVREARELHQNSVRLRAYQAIEDPAHAETLERHQAVRRSWDVPAKQAFVLLAFDEKRSRKVRAEALERAA